MQMKIRIIINIHDHLLINITTKIKNMIKILKIKIDIKIIITGHIMIKTNEKVVSIKIILTIEKKEKVKNSKIKKERRETKNILIKTQRIREMIKISGIKIDLTETKNTTIDITIVGTIRILMIKKIKNKQIVNIYGSMKKNAIIKYKMIIRR